MPPPEIPWAVDPYLSKAAIRLLSGQKLSQAEAIKTLHTLDTESAQWIRSRVGENFYFKHFPTLRIGGEWSAGNPCGIIDHYTAGISGTRTIRWFSNMARKPGSGTSSAHYVMPRDGTPIQLVNPLNHITWHARRHSYTHIGIEHVNAGLLRKVDGELKYQKKRQYPEDRVARVQYINGEHWEPYTAAQVLSNVFLKRLLLCALDTLDPSEFLDHQEVDPSRKRDCGPLWPLYAINNLVHSWAPVLDMMWLGYDYVTEVGVYELTREVNELIELL